MQHAPPTPQDWARFSPGALDGVTVMKAHFTDHTFERHSHETYSLGVTGSGVQTFNCGGILHASLPGDVMLFNPDEPHDGQRGTHEGFGYAMLYVSTEVVDECRDTAAGIRLPRHFGQPVVRDAGMGRELVQAIEAAGQPGESLRAEELTRSVLLRLLQRYGEQRVDENCRAAGDVRMARIRDLLRARYDEDLTVDTLANEAGLSRVHLTRAFTKEFGVPPHIYLNAVRVERAQLGMLAGSTLAEVAAACGFADQSHFSRRFKGSVGLSPGAWLRQMKVAS